MRRGVFATTSYSREGQVVMRNTHARAYAFALACGNVAAMCTVALYYESASVAVVVVVVPLVSTERCGLQYVVRV